jgi:hypothetical protein
MSNELAMTAQRLADLLTQENDALRRLDFSAAIAVVPAKEAALAELTKQPRPNVLPPPLVALVRRLGGLATDNQALLERAILVQTRVVRIVARASAPPPATNRYGGHNRRIPAHQTTALALSTRA